VFLSACPFGDSRTGTALNKSCWRHKFAFLNVSLKTGALPSALFVHHSKSSIIVCAGLLNSLLIRVAGTPLFNPANVNHVEISARSDSASVPAAKSPNFFRRP
jgi:hypothetical protein